MIKLEMRFCKWLKRLLHCKKVRTFPEPVLMITSIPYDQLIREGRMNAV